MISYGKQRRYVGLTALRESFLSIAMPWKRPVWSPNDDTITVRRPRFMVFWHSYGFGDGHIRWGWA